MEIPKVTGGYSGSVNRLTIGAAKDSGGSRTVTVTVGGSRNAVYAGGPEEAGARPVIAMDVPDSEPADWPQALAGAYENVKTGGAEWAKKCADEFGAELLCVKFDGIHPDKGDRDAAHAAAVTRAVLETVGIPLILWGSGNDEKDNEVMPKISEAAKSENCLIGTVTEGNYKALTAIALADGHSLITEAPLDINISKQVNILVSEMGFPVEKIVTFQSTGALGYGMEYSYSIQERQRLAALSGDRMMTGPVICDAGYEAWRAKEAKIDEPSWGPASERGPMWEAITAVCLLQAGADIVRMRHPKAVAVVRDFIEQVWK